MMNSVQVIPTRMKSLGTLFLFPIFLLVLTASSACDSDQDEDGWTISEGDCDDQNPQVYPGADELCNERDDDCDGQADEELPVSTWYPDLDADGFGDEDSGETACEQPEGYIEVGGDCDDSNPDVNPDAEERCDNFDNNCDGEVNEGFPSQTWYPDEDGDGYGTDEDSVYGCDELEGYVLTGGDCEDSDSAIHPGAEELCDEIDNDCDRYVDEGLTYVIMYPDLDGDGYAENEDGAKWVCNSEGYALYLGDCDDEDDTLNPSSVDVCDEQDNDCDGEIDEVINRTFYGDADGDGFGVAEEALASCDQPEGYARYDGDCDESSTEVNPSMLEVCDGIDNDCDGYADEESDLRWYPDDDGDGFGRSEDELRQCEGPAGHVLARGDCDDTDVAFHPGAEDPSDDGLDQDCGGSEGPEPHVGYSASTHDTIKGALSAAEEGDIIWVGPGTYYEYGVKMSTPGVTLISSHLAGETVIDAQQQGRVFSLASYMDPAQELDGFTLTAGRYAGSVGLHVGSYSSATVRNCIITQNVATSSDFVEGAGIGMSYATPTFIDCLITENTAEATASDNHQEVFGAGVYIWESSPTFINTTISKNVGKATSYGCDDEGFAYGAYASGGGVYAYGFVYFPNPTFIGCRISDNVVWARALGNCGYDVSGSGGFVGGAYLADTQDVVIDSTTFERNDGDTGVGGLAISGDRLEMTASKFLNNWAEISGGGAIGSDRTVIRQVQVIGNVATVSLNGGLSLSGDEVTVENALIEGNSASNAGGLSFYGYGGSFALVNSTIAGNSAGSGGGLFLWHDVYSTLVTPEVSNSILAYNQGYNLYDSTIAPTAPQVAYCDIYSPEGEANHNLPTLDSSNLSVEPEFLLYEASGLPVDYHLSQASPLVDAGDPSSADPDASRSDLGIYGGPSGGDWDRDADGWYDYFWPGTLSDAPPDFNSSDYDSNDRDPVIH